jgi:DNA helicase-2/ATP-dependent DNA helicase PcrA
MANNIEKILKYNLTESQNSAALDDASRVLCLACAGSGKSRTLAFRIARLMAEGYTPESIVAFTFTNKAAESIKRRVSYALSEAEFDPKMVGSMFIGTIHSYCGNILQEMDARYQQFDQLDNNRLKLYLISRYSDLRLSELRYRGGSDTGYFKTIRKVSNAWKTLNNEMAGTYEVREYHPLLANILDRLKERLDQDYYIDFSMMVRQVVEALEDENEDALRVVESVRHVMCDEYQDVNPAEESLIRRLDEHTESLFVVGDDDQSIYAWRGADVQNIITFGNRYPGEPSVHTLSRNFRSTNAIVSAANVFISDYFGPARVSKNPEAEHNRTPRDIRTLHFDNRPEEAEWVADRIDELLGTAYEEDDGTRGLTPSDFAILMRSTASTEQNGQPRHAAFTDELGQRNIPFTLTAGGSIFDRPQVSVLRESFELLRDGAPNRNTARTLFDNTIQSAYPRADFTEFAEVLAFWGREIHGSRTAGRRRVYPQQLVHDLLDAFNLGQSDFDEGVMQDIGAFSRIMEDVETVHVSIDSEHRFQNVLNFLSNAAERGYDSEDADDILRRPNAVTVSTVHSAKGLEFPAVFVADAQNQRFPRPRSNYDGWMPEEVIQDAVDRGAYQGTRDEEARLFYTAVTRAERYLYVTGSQSLPEGSREYNPSPFAAQLAHDEVATDLEELPTGLESHDQERRVEEDGVPTSFSDIRYYLRCPKDFQLRKIFGFSPAIEPMFGFGNAVHSSVGRMHQLFEEEAPNREEAEELTDQLFHLKHVPPSNDPDNNPGPYERAQEKAKEITGSYAESYSDDFSHRRQIEQRFEIPIAQATISGSIDLLLRYDREENIVEATVVDFKTMEGGEEPAENPDLDWTELALQVQLYAQAAAEVLGENARTGSVHMLKDNERVEVPVDDEARDTAIANVEWAVNQILAEDFPMRPSAEKCAACDFRQLCAQEMEEFSGTTIPPPIHIPGDRDSKHARAFSEVEGD